MHVHPHSSGACVSRQQFDAFPSALHERGARGGTQQMCVGKACSECTTTIASNPAGTLRTNPTRTSSRPASVLASARRTPLTELSAFPEVVVARGEEGVVLCGLCLERLA